MDKACCQGTHEKGHVHDCHGPAPFFGRLLLSLLFLWGALGKMVNFGASAAALRSLGIAGAEVYIVIGLLLELVGALMILVGWYTRIGIYLLMIFLIPTTIMMHGFWRYEGVEGIEQLTQFLKNLAIFGGLLLLWSYGPGRWSIDNCRCCHRNSKIC